MRAVLLAWVAMTLLSETAIANDEVLSLVERAEAATAPIAELPLLLLPTISDQPLSAPDRPSPQERPAWLPALYANVIALQVYDVYSTTTALGRGGVEVNPVVDRLMAQPGAWIAVKAGATTLTIMAAERLWKRQHRVAAVATMVVSNGLLAFVTMRNARVLASIR